VVRQQTCQLLFRVQELLSGGGVLLPGVFCWELLQVGQILVINLPAVQQYMLNHMIASIVLRGPQEFRSALQ
jgi:hypothetical protein